MRLLALLVAFAMLSAGCVAEDEPGDEGTAAADLDADGIPDATDDSDADGTPDAIDPTPRPALPDPIVFEGNLKGFGYQGVAPVPPPVDPVPACTVQQCAEHVVTVPAGNWIVTFTLAGAGGMVSSNDPVGVVSTDYDLFVDGVGESTNASGEEDTVSARLGPGDYSAQVLGWQDLDGGYTLTVTFAY